MRKQKFSASVAQIYYSALGVKFHGERQTIQIRHGDNTITTLSVYPINVLSLRMVRALQVPDLKLERSYLGHYHCP